MFSDASIRVTNLSKQHVMFDKPQDRLKQFLSMGRRKYYREFSALSDVSFELLKGEALGVIGQNGAGKSTLLQLISGTLHPTAGHVEVNGRVAALLELGSGFNPEFTGRENVYINASIMGLSQQEIDESFDDIASFADIGDFIDQPVKTYSSGMHVRLAFSTATSVDPDILIIDEALSVGDFQFQKKCIDRMMQFKDSGKTILFCSHSMYHVQELCKQALWLHKGRVQAQGPTNEIVAGYLAEMERTTAESGNAPESSSHDSSHTPEVTVEEIFLTDIDGNVLSRAEQFQTIVINIKTRRHGAPLEGHIASGLVKPDGQIMFGATTRDTGLEPIVFSGEQHIKLVIPSLPLISGAYQATAITGDANALVAFHKRDSDCFHIIGQRPELGVIWMEHEWKTP